MTWESWFLEQEGLDPAKIKAILDNTEHLLGVVENNLDNVNALLKQVTALAAVVQSELPRAKQLAHDIRNQIAAYEARQKEYGR